MQKEEGKYIDAIAAELCRKRVVDGYSSERLSVFFKALEARVQEHAKGDVLVQKGKRALRTGIILKGCALVQMNVVRDRPVRVMALSAGRFVGLASVMMDRMHYPVSCVAFSDCTVLWLSAEKLRAWRKDPSSAAFFAMLTRQMFGLMDRMTRRCAILGQARLGDEELACLQRHFEDRGAKSIDVSWIAGDTSGAGEKSGAAHPAAAADGCATPEDLWQQAQALAPDADPESSPEHFWKYMKLLVSAAEGGSVPALAQLGEQAFHRRALVEAYFWTKAAHRRLSLTDPGNGDGLSEIAAMACDIRREWLVADCPSEYDNEYRSFTEQRGEIGRALLRIDCGIDVAASSEQLRRLADAGNADAALFAYFSGGLASEFLRRTPQSESLVARIPFPCGAPQLERALQRAALDGRWREAHVKLDDGGDLIVTY